MRALFSLSLLVFCAQLFAAEFKPYPSAQITPEQWLVYYNEVKGAYGATLQVVADQHLELYQDKEMGVHFAFTQQGHPAHPAWIARQPVQNDKTIDIRTIGYFAGEEPPFAHLFKQYLELNEQVKKDMKRQIEQANEKSN